MHLLQALTCIPVSVLSDSIRSVATCNSFCSSATCLHQPLHIKCVHSLA